ncbi:class I SAM-dependent methyltransferase [Phormidesmis sp. 146-12]
MPNQECPHFSNALFNDIPQDGRSNYFSPVWEQVLSKVKIHNLLDAGCGTGVFSCAVKPQITGQLIGIDASRFALEKARQYGFDKTHLVKDFCTQPFPLENASVDFILCKDVFEHLLDPLHLLKEFRRVLTPKGYLLINVSNHFPLMARIKFLFTQDIGTWNYFPSANCWNFPHIRFFNYKTVLEFLSQEKFDLIENYCGFFPSVPLTRL